MRTVKTVPDSANDVTKHVDETLRKEEIKVGTPFATGKRISGSSLKRKVAKRF
jgi:hypothetical protein